jgi:hypothetical protein
MQNIYKKIVFLLTNGDNITINALHKTHASIAKSGVTIAPNQRKLHDWLQDFVYPIFVL